MANNDLSLLFKSFKSSNGLNFWDRYSFRGYITGALIIVKTRKIKKSLCSDVSKSNLIKAYSVDIVFRSTFF